MEPEAELEAELDEDDPEPEPVHPAATGINAAPATDLSTDLRRILYPFYWCRRPSEAHILPVKHRCASYWNEYSAQM